MRLTLSVDSAVFSSRPFVWVVWHTETPFDSKKSHKCKVLNKKKVKYLSVYTKKRRKNIFLKRKTANN
uniref:Uncharacterized protein n=1 Tax=Anguilla anguilla TaxID=7936 RepID=A0A0E9SZ47_ANGAN